MVDAQWKERAERAEAEVERLSAQRELYGSPEVQRRLHKAEAERFELQEQLESCEGHRIGLKAERDHYKVALDTIADPKFWYPNSLLDAQGVARAALTQQEES
jgi:hypothetical protein